MHHGITKGNSGEGGKEGQTFALTIKSINSVQSEQNLYIE